MELIRELTTRQEAHGFLSEADLKAIARDYRVPLYRLEGLVGFYPHFRKTPPARWTVKLCRDVCCKMACGEPLAEELRSALADRTDVDIEETSCLGRCDSAPAVMLNDIPLAPLTLADLTQLLEFVQGSKPLPDDRPTDSPRAWKCDPYSHANQHYNTARELIASSQHLAEVCVERLTNSKLRGMGGAGFPTGRKWELVAAQPAEPKYVICNADESEPGTFKDRVILEELPHLVIEGLLLAGLTIGAEQGIVFLRHEYTREHHALETALKEARLKGILGPNAAGSGRKFDMEIFLSPGGYILGEETALLEALEDKRGEPRNKPPYPGTHGLWGKPTLINNVETFALATSIIHHNTDWWQSQGAGEFAGLKFVSVSGDVANPGVYEIPHGLTVAEVIQLAGGMKDGKPLLAFLPGGASSNFLTADHASLPMEIDAMKQAGSMLGTGAVIVLAEDRDLFALATNLVRFFRNESCGKCVPCRIGSQRAVELLEGVAAGQIESQELDLLPQLAETLEQTSICGLGQVALNPVMSMLHHFPNAKPKPLP